MPKVRDLGTTVIPVTMRPLEIGPGGAVRLGDAHAHPMQMACAGTSTCIECACNNTTRETTSCTPSGWPSGTQRPEKDTAKKKSAPFTANAMMLRDQLRARVAETRSH